MHNNPKIKITILSLSYCLTMLEHTRYSIYKIKPFHIVFFLFIIFLFFKIRNLKLAKSEVITLLLFILSTLLSLLNSSYFIKSLFWTFNIYITALGALAIGVLIKPTVNQIFTSIVIGSLPSVIIGLHEYIYNKINNTSQWFSIIRIYSTAYEPSSLALMLFPPIIPFLIFLMHLGEKKESIIQFPYFITFLSAFSFLIFLLSTGRSGWICLPVFLLYYLLKSLTLRKVIIIATVCILVLIGFFNFNSINLLFTDYFNRNIQNDPRFIGAVMGLKIFLLNPIAGTGVGSFGAEVQNNYIKYWYDNLDTLSSTNIQNLKWSLTTYNVIIEYLVNFGVVGLISLSMMINLFYKKCSNNIKFNLVFLTTISMSFGLLFNQNLFRSYFLFLPLVFYGSQLQFAARKELNILKHLNKI